MNIAIVDDHKIVRMGLSLLVNTELPGAEISEAANASELLKLLAAKKMDMMLLDLKMPETNSIGLLEQVLNIYPNIKVLIISQNPERVFALRYLKAGAFGYVEKGADDITLKKALLQVAEGKKYMSDDVVQQMADFLKNGKSTDPFAKLSKNELMVSNYLVNGTAIRGICEAMNLRASTVATYKMRIFEKLGIKTLHELTQLASLYDIN